MSLGLQTATHRKEILATKFNIFIFFSIWNLNTNIFVTFSSYSIFRLIESIYLTSIFLIIASENHSASICLPLVKMHIFLSRYSIFDIVCRLCKHHLIKMRNFNVIQIHDFVVYNQLQLHLTQSHLSAHQIHKSFRFHFNPINRKKKHRSNVCL